MWAYLAFSCAGKNKKKVAILEEKNTFGAFCKGKYFFFFFFFFFF